MTNVIEEWRELLRAALFSAIGATIGAGQLLAATPDGTAVSRRALIGRALTTAGLSMITGACLIWIPDLPFLAQIGIAALLASLGASGLERIFNRVIEGRPQ